MHQTWLQQDIYDESCQLLIGLTLSPTQPREPLPGLYEPIPAPTMMNNPVHMTPEVGPIWFPSSWTGWHSLLLPDVQLQAVDAKASPQGNGATSHGQ